MCVNYRPPSPELLNTVMGIMLNVEDPEGWKLETWKDYPAPIIRRGAHGPEAVLASYGMIPAHHLPPGARFDTMNARAESVGEKRAFARAWRDTQLCLVPMTAFFEPNYERGKCRWMGIGMADDSLFAVAGLWRAWPGAAGGSVSFTQLTINADAHPLMNRMQRPGDEKRSLVILPQEHWYDWLHCDEPELARSFLRPFPADRMKAWPKVPEPEQLQATLF